MPTRDNTCSFQDSEGSIWRAYRFIENAQTYDKVQSMDQAFQAARAFGEFQRQLTSLPGPPLVETIPDFHNTRKRFDALQSAVDADKHSRATQVKEEIEFARAREPIVDVLLDLQLKGEIQEITTHNDTKLNNVMLDNDTGQGICVIDLDTVMPGLSLYDFGDMARSATRPTTEDETDLSTVEVRLDMFEALTRGYLLGAGPSLSQAEKDHLVFAAKLITFEIGLRFLTDHLQGDTYFKIHRPDQNLDRCRVQFKMVESFERNEAAMMQCVEQLLDAG
jgi:aminoglycoside phosphotransferase (APT) family kinase protein